MNAIAEARRWYWMRLSSMVLAVCVVVHVVTIVYAVRGGLTAAEVLSRTHGNWAFAVFYGIFVLGCAVHVPLGLQAIVEEWLGARESVARAVAWLSAAVIVVMGGRAIIGVVGA